MRHPPSSALRTRILCLSIALHATLLAACAAPGTPAVPRVDEAPSTARPVQALTVSEVRGKAWVRHQGRTRELKAGAEIPENQPIQVGSRSSLHLQLGDRTGFELAPSARLVVHQLPRLGGGDAAATWLRLEQGYLRIQHVGTPSEPPMQISFGIWAARLTPGEYFFDTRGRVAAACALDGSMRLSGVPEWTPQGALQACLKLEANKSPLAIAMDPDQWDAVRAQRRLHPTLARAARRPSTPALARRQPERAPSPEPPPPDPVMPAAAPSVRVSAHRAVSPPPLPPSPPEPVPAAEPQPLARHAPPVIVIPPEAEPEPELATAHEDLPIVAEPPPTRHVPPVIVIPSEVDPAPEPAPDVAAAAAPVPHAPPVITLPVEPDPEPNTHAAEPPPAIRLAEQSPVTIPPSSQQPNPAETSRRPDRATPPSVPLAVAMYSVAAMPDRIDATGGELIVPPTITHEPARSQWRVDIASYPSIDGARQHARLLVQQKMRADVREQALPDRMNYLVVIEGFATEAQAETAAIDLEARFDLD